VLHRLLLPEPVPCATAAEATPAGLGRLGQSEPRAPAQTPPAGRPGWRASRLHQQPAHIALVVQ